MKKKSDKFPAIASPCISVCTMNEETGFCRGCFRTLQEITDWERYSNDGKREVLARLDERQRDRFSGDS